MAEQQLLNGDVGAARRTIAGAIAARDDIVELHVLRARIEIAAGSQAGAYDAFSDALSLDPVNGQALHGVSQLGLTTGHLRESLQATERILTLAPDNPDALLARGIHSLIRRRYEEANAYADRILAGAPGHENASVLKARASFMAGDIDAALLAITAHEETGSGSAATDLTKLEIYRELQRPVEISQQFARLHQLRPDDLALRLDEANFRFKRGERAAAQELVADVLANPRADRGAVDTAIRLWEEYGAADLGGGAVASIAESGSAVSKASTARFFITTGDFGRAAQLISSVAVQNKQSLNARLFARRGNHAVALRLANDVLALDETNCDALIANSESNLALGHGMAALRSAQHAAAECPERIAAWLAASEAYKALGRSAGIERVYNQALDSHPQSLRVARPYAEWLLQEERDREAIAIGRKITRAAPASLGGWKFYVGLCERTESDCRDDALRGLAEAETMYWIDLPPGTLPPNGLIGRLTRR